MSQDNVVDLVDAIVAEAEKIVLEIGPLLAGRGSAQQAAVLASLTAKWVAGHVASDEATVHAELLERHVECVRKLIPLEVATRKRRSGI